MRKLSLMIAGLCALAAWAGTRAKDSSGAQPSAASDGVSLNDSIGCRASVRVTDGGTINGGKLLAWYYDPVLGWVRASTLLDCSLEANKLPDGGAPSAQVCLDFEPAARFGRIGFQSSSLVGADGGSPNGFDGTDGGQHVAPVVRVECWGPTIP